MIFHIFFVFLKRWNFLKLCETFWNFVKFAIETFIEISSDFKKPEISELYPQGPIWAQWGP